MYILSLLTVIRVSFWCDIFVFQREKSLKRIIFHGHQEPFHQRLTGMTIIHPSPPNYSCVTFAISNGKRPQPQFTTDTVHKSQSLVSLQLH